MRVLEKGYLVSEVLVGDFVVRVMSSTITLMFCPSSIRFSF